MGSPPLAISAGFPLAEDECQRRIYDTAV